MKFIKASERLPEQPHSGNENWVVFRQISDHRNCEMINFSRVTSPKLLLKIPLEDLEWLDESKTPSTPILGAEEVLEKLMGNYEDCFDKHTRTTGGGYEADTTDKWELWRSFSPEILSAMQTHSAQYRDECDKLKQGMKDIVSYQEEEKYLSVSPIDLLTRIHSIATSFK